MPELFLKLNEYVIEGDFVKARKLQDEVNEVIKGLLSGPSLYAVCKYILKLRGVETGEVRGPMLPISKPEHVELAERLNKRIQELIEEYK